MSYSYDLIAVGAGVAGGAAARAARDGGLKVAVVESDKYGGTCPLRGCNPKKVLLGAAETVARARAMRGRGVRGELTVDWAELQDFKRTFVDDLPGRIEESYVKRGIDALHGTARLTGPNSLEVDGRELTARHIFLGPGSWPRALGVPGEELITLSDAFLDLTALPRRIVFIGGGYISFEFAHMAARAGSEATILHRSAQVLKGYEPELADVIVAASRDAGIAVHTGQAVAGVQRRGEDLVVLTEGGGEYPCDMAVHGAGRTPNVAGLGLDEAGVAVDDKGFILVDEYMRSTSNPAVFAGGDAARTPYALTPASNHEGQVAAHNILNGDTLPVNQAGIPRVVFSVPPLAAIGPTEAEAKENGLDFEVRSGSMAEWLPWERLGESHAAYKILSAPDEGRIIAAHLAGHHAEELANIFALAVRLGLTVRDVQKTIWAYPTSGYYLQYMLPH